MVSGWRAGTLAPGRPYPPRLYSLFRAAKVRDRRPEQLSRAALRTVKSRHMHHYLVSDTLNNRVANCPSASVGSDCVEMVSGLSFPNHVLVLTSGEHLVTDTDAHRVLRCSSTSRSTASECTTVAGGNGGGSGTAQLFYPQAAAVDDNGDCDMYRTSDCHWCMSAHLRRALDSGAKGCEKHTHRPDSHTAQKFFTLVAER